MNGTDVIAAFDSALRHKRHDYVAARGLARSLFFLEAQRSGEIDEQRALVARLHDRARAAAQRGEASQSTLYLERKDRVLADIALDELALCEARGDARQARQRLFELTQTLDGLARDRRRAQACFTTGRLHDLADRPLPEALEAALERARGVTRRVLDVVAMRAQTAW